MKKLIVLVSLAMFLYACNDSYEEVELEPTATNSVLSSPTSGTSQVITHPEDYNRGVDTGKEDGQWLIDDTFWEGNCREDLLFQVANDDGLCYYTTPSQLNTMNEFIRDYNANLDALISSTLGGMHAFHSGVKYGFNLKVCEFGAKYGYATFCAYVEEAPPVDDSGFIKAPTSLRATTASSSRISLSWNDNSSSEGGFRIERRTGNGSFSQIATVGANVTSYSNSGLAASTTYSYRVRAFKGSDNSNYSNIASATTQSSGGGGDDPDPIDEPCGDQLICG